MIKPDAGTRVSVRQFLLDLKDPRYKPASTTESVTSPSRSLFKRPSRVHGSPHSVKRCSAGDIRLAPAAQSEAEAFGVTPSLMSTRNACDAKVSDSRQSICPGSPVNQRRTKLISLASIRSQTTSVEAEVPPFDSFLIETPRIGRTYSKQEGKIQPAIAVETLPSCPSLSQFSSPSCKDNKTSAASMHQPTDDNLNDDPSNCLVLSPGSTGSKSVKCGRLRNRVVRKPAKAQRKARHDNGVIERVNQRKKRRAPMNELALVHELPIRKSSSQSTEVRKLPV